jgi:hypothetical protein
MAENYKYERDFDTWKELLGAKGERKDGEVTEAFDYYPFLSDFKRKVLDPVKKELDKGKVSFTYEIKKNLITITRKDNAVLVQTKDGDGRN